MTEDDSEVVWAYNRQIAEIREPAEQLRYTEELIAWLQEEKGSIEKRIAQEIEAAAQELEKEWNDADPSSDQQWSRHKP